MKVWGGERKHEWGNSLCKGMGETLQLSCSSLRNLTCTYLCKGRMHKSYIHNYLGGFLTRQKKKIGMRVTPYAGLAVCALHMQSLIFYVWDVMQSLCQVLTVGLHFCSDSIGIFPFLILGMHWHSYWYIPSYHSQQRGKLKCMEEKQSKLSWDLTDTHSADTSVYHTMAEKTH